MDGIKILARNRDERPAFVLEDVENASFTRPQLPVVAGVPLYALREVERFRLRDAAHLPDMNLDQVRHQEILPECNEEKCAVSSPTTLGTKSRD